MSAWPAFADTWQASLLPCFCWWISSLKPNGLGESAICAVAQLHVQSRKKEEEEEEEEEEE
jgi:hypothetical protein